MELDKKIARGKCIITISMALLLISMGLQMYRVYSISGYGKEYEIIYESVDIKSMSKAAIAQKEDKSTIIKTIVHGNIDNGPITEVELPKVEKVEQEPAQPTQPTTPEVPQKIWYLPTEQGYVTQNPSYSHATALDISSARGTAETIYPVANGVISGIYLDSAGALVVAVNHDINGQKYTSLYAHLSSYADGIYVGKPVTPFDPLGQMGTTGYSTGVHLHLVLVDCSLFDPNDPSCHDLNSYFNYTKQRQNEGFIGFGAVYYVPASWWSR